MSAQVRFFCQISFGTKFKKKKKSFCCTELFDFRIEAKGLWTSTKLFFLGCNYNFSFSVPAFCPLTPPSEVPEYL